MSPSSPDPLLIASQPPDPHRVVPGGGGDGKPGRCYRDLRDPVLVAPEVAEVGAGDVPHVDGRVVTGGKQKSFWLVLIISSWMGNNWNLNLISFHILGTIRRGTLFLSFPHFRKYSLRLDFQQEGCGAQTKFCQSAQMLVHFWHNFSGEFKVSRLRNSPGSN